MIDSLPRLYPQIKTSVATTISATTSPSFTFPVAPGAGSVIVVFWASTTTTTVSMSSTGFSSFAASPFDQESDSHAAGAAWKNVTPGENTQTTWTLTNLFNANETGNLLAVALNNTQSVEFNYGVNFDSGNAVTSHLIPALSGLSTTGTSYSGLKLGYVSSDGTGTYTTPTGWTIIESSNTNQASWLGRRNAFFTENTDSTVSVTISSGNEYVGWSVLARRAAFPRTYDFAAKSQLRRDYYV